MRFNANNTRLEIRSSLRKILPVFMIGLIFSVFAYLRIAKLPLYLHSVEVIINIFIFLLGLYIIVAVINEVLQKDSKIVVTGKGLFVKRWNTGLIPWYEIDSITLHSRPRHYRDPYGEVSGVQYFIRVHLVNGPDQSYKDPYPGLWIFYFGLQRWEIITDDLQVNIHQLYAYLKLCHQKFHETSRNLSFLSDQIDSE